LTIIALKNPVQAQAGEVPERVIKRAIAAQGGETLLRQTRAGRVKAKGTIPDPEHADVSYPFIATIDFQLPDRFKIALDAKLQDDEKFSTTSILNHDQTWVTPPSGDKRYDERTLVDFKNSAHAEYLKYLVPLLEVKEVHLELMDQGHANGKEVYTIKATTEDKPDVRLFFEKKSEFLIGLEYKSIEPTTGRATKVERYFDDYRDPFSTSASQQLLAAAHIESTPAALLQFLRQQIISEEEQRKIRELIHRLGDSSFEIREKARDELVAMGSRAAGLLTEALNDSDVEVVRRARDCLKKIGEAKVDSVKNIDLLSAAVEMLAAGKSNDPVSVDVLLDLAPAVNDRVLPGLSSALAVLAVHDGKPDPRLEKALDDKNPRRRAIAAAALGRAPKDTDLRVEVPLVLPGLKWAMKETVLRNGKRYYDWETTQVLFYSKLREDVFAKPGAQ
jgi:hypothetical protein